MSRAVAIVAIVGSAACTPSEALQNVAPKPPGVGDALGEGPCAADEAFAEPLVVDMKSHERAKVELALGKGPAVFRYDCDKLELLPGCTIDEGSYHYVGFSKKERVLKLTSADELHVNLPTMGAAWAAELSADLESDTSLDVALVTVGQRSTSVSHVARDSLNGTCDGATHFLKHAYIGSFAVAAGNKASAQTAAKLFGTGVAAGASSSKFERVVDGDLKACATASAKDEAPPDGCGAIMRIGLMPLLATINAKAPGGDEPACPEGMIQTGLFCSADTTMNRCRQRDLAACQALCDKGDRDACYWRAALDFDHPEESLRKLRPMCEEHEMMAACETVATQMRDIDLASAVPYFGKACELGDGPSCRHFAGDLLTTKSERASKEDRLEALAAYRRGCSLADAQSCIDAGRFYIEPDKEKRAVEPDEQQALAMFLEGCFGMHALCGTAAQLVDGQSWCAIHYLDENQCQPPPTSSKPVERDPARARALYRRACPPGTQSTVCKQLEHLR